MSHGDFKMKNNNKSVVPLLFLSCINLDFCLMYIYSIYPLFIIYHLYGRCSRHNITVRRPFFIHMTNFSQSGNLIKGHRRSEQIVKTIAS